MSREHCNAHATFVDKLPAFDDALQFYIWGGQHEFGVPFPDLLQPTLIQTYVYVMEGQIEAEQDACPWANLALQSSTKEEQEVQILL